MKLAFTSLFPLVLCILSVLGEESLPAQRTAISTNTTSTSNEKVPVDVRLKQEVESTNRTAPTESTHTSSSVPVTSTPETITTSSPAPTHGDWKVVDPKTNITCIRIKGDLQVNFIHGNSSDKNVTTYDIPPTAVAFGNCSTQQIALKLNAKLNDWLNITFSRNETNYHVSHIIGAVTIQSNSSTVFEKFSGTFKDAFCTPLNQSYICSNDLGVEIGKPLSKNVTTVFKSTSIQMEAFKKTVGDSFDPAYSCSSSKHTPDIVPIIVGCALALLVIAVLVAYLVSRRRSQAQGYLSM